METELTACRREIDRIDRELLALFAERMEVSARVAAYKREHGLPVLDPAREQEKLRELRCQSPEGLSEYAAAMFEKLMELSRSYQQRLLETEAERTGQSK